MFSRVSLVAFAIVVAFSLSGCGPESSQTPSEEVSAKPSPIAGGPSHVHPSEGPHGGHLIELGNGEYHAELLHDEKTHAVTVHLLDATGKLPVSVPQPEITIQLFRDGEFVTYALKGVQGPADATGTASEFVIVDAALCDALSLEDEVRGRLQVTIDGKPYPGTIEPGSHDHEGHSH